MSEKIPQPVRTRRTRVRTSHASKPGAIERTEKTVFRYEYDPETQEAYSIQWEEIPSNPGEAITRDIIEGYAVEARKLAQRFGYDSFLEISDSSTGVLKSWEQIGHKLLSASQNDKTLNAEFFAYQVELGCTLLLELWEFNRSNPYEFAANFANTSNHYQNMRLAQLEREITLGRQRLNQKHKGPRHRPEVVVKALEIMDLKIQTLTITPASKKTADSPELIELLKGEPAPDPKTIRKWYKESRGGSRTP